MSVTRVAFIDGREASLAEFLEFAAVGVLPASALHARGEADSHVTVTEGGRNVALNKHLFRYRMSGASDADVEAEAERFNRECLDPPLSEREVRQVVASVSQVEPGVGLEERLRQMNEHFALCVVGDKTRVIWMQPDGSWKFLRNDAFFQLFENQWVVVNEKRKNLGRFWMQHPTRRTFTGIVFEPGGNQPPGTFNLFRGWARKPRPGDCSLFLDHISTNCARGNPEHTHWILAWLADIFQHPDKKKGTALVLIGPQGCGKSIVGNIIGTLLGAHYLLASDEVHVTGRFNAHQEALLLLHSDEATFAGDHATAGKLKDFVTGSYSVIERKGIDAVVVRNHARLLVTSEQHWVVPASLVERRFAVFELGRDHLQDRAVYRLSVIETAVYQLTSSSSA